MKRAGAVARRLKQLIETKTEEYYELQEPLEGEKTIADSLFDSASRFFRHIRENASFFRQSAVAHLLSILAGLFAGIFLAKSEEMLLLLPGLIMLVPAAIGMRGNIFSSLGSRLSSALHLGTVEKFSVKNSIVKNNIYAALLISVIFSTLLAFVARVIMLAFGIQSISVLELIVISFLGGILAGVVLLFFTFLITFLSHSRGWDPDNVTAPIITALGDMFTIPALIIASIFVLAFPSLVFFAGSLILLLCVMSIVAVIKTKKTALKSIIIQSSPVLIAGIVLDAFAGLILQSNINSLVLFPVAIFLVPGFLEQGGNIGNILASRLSTKLHLGLIQPFVKLEKGTKIEIINTYIFAFILFPLLGALTFYAAMLMGIGGLSLALVLAAVIVAGIVLVTVVIALAFFASVLSFRFNLDPDNTTLPLIASTADLVGVISLMAVLHLFGMF